MQQISIHDLKKQRENVKGIVANKKEKYIYHNLCQKNETVG